MHTHLELADGRHFDCQTVAVWCLALSVGLTACPCRLGDTRRRECMSAWRKTWRPQILFLCNTTTSASNPSLRDLPRFGHHAGYGVRAVGGWLGRPVSCSAGFRHVIRFVNPLCRFRHHAGDGVRAHGGRHGCGRPGAVGRHLLPAVCLHAVLPQRAQCC